MIELFQKGGPIMWPILLTSIIAVTVVIDRLFFIVRERFRRDPRAVREILEKAERGDYAGAMRIGEGSRDFVVRALTYALSRANRFPRRFSAPPPGSSSDSVAELLFLIRSSRSRRCLVFWERSRV